MDINKCLVLEMIILGDIMDLEKNMWPREDVLESLSTYLEGDTLQYTPSLFLTVSIVITALLHEFLL